MSLKVDGRVMLLSTPHLPTQHRVAGTRPFQPAARHSRQGTRKWYPFGSHHEQAGKQQPHITTISALAYDNSSSLKSGATDSIQPGLYIVSTPIGNLQDMTLRALHVLKVADVILAEDTRHTRKLLNAFDIKTPLVSYHAHNEKGKEAYVLDMLSTGQAVALVSDAGTPAISDPGAGLVAAAVAQGHQVVPIPGASALLSALVASGLPTDRFLFHGFLPPKSGARLKVLEGLRAVQATLVFYVPPHGLMAVLRDVGAAMGADCRLCVARELTKLHEEFVRGNVTEVAAAFEDREPRGEFVLLVESTGEQRSNPKAGSQKEAVEEALKKLLDNEVSVSAASRLVAQELGIRRKGVYEIAQKLKDSAVPAEGGVDVESEASTE